MNNIMEIKEIKKSFGNVNVIRGISFTVAPGDFIAIMGSSGSGKTTLLHMMAGLELPTAGQILFQDGQDISNLDEDSLALWRRNNIGLVFQSFHLIPTISAAENVAFPYYPTQVKSAQRLALAKERLEQVGLGHRIDHRPPQLSGGEKQRVAIARALVTNPSLILADEPTGNLDSKNGDEIMTLFQRLNKEEGVAIVLITHDLQIASKAKRMLTIKDGLLISSNGNHG